MEASLLNNAEDLSQAERVSQDNRALREFWDKAFAPSEEDRASFASDENGADGLDPESWRELAPSRKLFDAAASLGQCARVLDYGCGTAWAGIIAAKHGCGDVTAADVAPGAVETASMLVSAYGLADRIRPVCIDFDWLRGVPDQSYDGIICSNVLDVVPPETAEDILREFARIAAPGGRVIIGLNYYLSAEKAAQKGLELAGGNRLYVDGVLRLVSRSDEEWAAAFAPRFTVEKLDHFAWPGEAAETRRLFWLTVPKATI